MIGHSDRERDEDAHELYIFWSLENFPTLIFILIYRIDQRHGLEGGRRSFYKYNECDMEQKDDHMNHQSEDQGDL